MGPASNTPPVQGLGPPSNQRRLWATLHASGRTGSTRSGGESGIRTHDGLLTHTHFPGVRLRPLGHLSDEAAIISGPSNEKGPRRAAGLRTATAGRQRARVSTVSPRRFGYRTCSTNSCTSLLGARVSRLTTISVMIPAGIPNTP